LGVLSKFVMLAAAVLAFAPCAWAGDPAAAARTNVLFPESIRLTLDQEYPGWKLATASPAVQRAYKAHQETHPPSVVTGDFNHDGQKDFVVQIALTTPGQEEQIVIAFLAQNDGYEEIILQSMGLDPSVYLWTSNKDLLLVLGGPAGDTAYAFDDGRFHEVPLPENAELPPFSIPRPPDPAPERMEP
jgi:hypothetical protein